MKLSKRYLVIGAAAVLLLAVGLVLFLVLSKKPETAGEGKIEEVTLQRDQASITLKRDGTLTVKIAEGTFQQQWDEKKVRSFFAQFENEDLSAYVEPETGFDGYFLTLTTGGGRQVNYFIPFTGTSLPPVLDELIEDLEEISGGVVNPTPTPLPTVAAVPTPTVTVRPTPAPTLVIPTPTPTPAAGEEEAYKIPFECDFTDPDVRSNVMSETVCTPR